MIPGSKLGKGTRRSASWPGALLLVLCFSAFVLLRSQSPEKKLGVYSPQATYTVSIQDRNGVEYVGLIDLLEPLGKVEAKGDKNWKLDFTPTGSDKATELGFSNNKRKGKVRGAQFELPANFLLVSGRGYVPLASLPNLLPRVLELTVQLRESGHRLFLGAVAMKFNAELRKNPSRLVFTFPAPVNPFLASEGNNTRIVFSREPVISPGADTINYGDPLIASTAFSENNGAAELTVHGNGPLLATFSDGGRTLTIAGAPQQQATAPPPAAPSPQTAAPTAAPRQPALTQVPVPTMPRFLVVIDPGHGGDERGAALTETLAEKDVTLAFARRIHRELETKGISAMLIRNSDSTLTLDQRAIAANTSRPAVFISVHASTLGSGVRVYTALLPPAAPTTRSAFLPWTSAQAAFLDSSSAVAGSIAAECNNRKVPVRAIAASLRPLNSITGAALSIELAPPPESNVDDITSEKYQQSIASAITAGIVAVRPKLEAAR